MGFTQIAGAEYLNDHSPQVPDHPRGTPRNTVANFLVWYATTLRAPLRLLAVWMRTFADNRKRADRIIARHRIATVLKVLSVATVATWIIVWMLASDAQRDRLTESVRAYLGENSMPDRGARD